MSAVQKYSATQRLGSGPTCDVFVGRDVGGLGREVVIKRLRDEARQHVARRDAFFESVERWSSLADDGLVTLFDLDRADAAVVYDRHRLSGTEVIASGWRPAAEIAAWMRDAFGGLSKLHDHGFLHFNLKPTNVLIANSGKAKLVDGLCLDWRGSGELPRPSGGHKHLAPEMIDPSVGKIGPASDLYCLAFVLLEMLLGPAFDRMFPGVGEGAIDPDRNWLRWHVDPQRPLPSLEEHAPQVPPGLRRVFERALHKSPLQRHHNVEELLAELRAAEQETGAAVAPTSEGENGATSPTPETAEAPSTEGGAPPRIDDIPNRPRAPVILRFLGCEAEMAGVNSDFFTVSDDADADVQLPEPLRGDGPARLRFSRGAEGWRLTAADDRVFYVNQQACSGLTPLRSGDVVRLAPVSGGLQFTIVHQQADPLARIAARYAPRLLQADSNPTRPRSTAPAGPADGAEPQRFAPASPSTGSAAPVAPAPAGPAPAGPAAGGPAPGGTAAESHDAPSVQPAEGAGSFIARALTEFHSWDKSKRNNALLAALLVLMALVIGLWPSGDDDAAAAPEAKPAAADPAPSSAPPATGDAAPGATTEPIPQQETGADE